MSEHVAEKDASRVRVYIEPADWWIGYYRGPSHHYLCPLPCVVIRWPRKNPDPKEVYVVVKAPWTPEDVRHLNAYQEADFIHPFTCRNRDDHEGDGLLIATQSGWVCGECDHTQDWAHEFMFDPAWLTEMTRVLPPGE